MRAGEVWFLISVAVFLSGGIFTAVKAAPDMTVLYPESQLPETLSVYDQLKLEIQPYHFGGVPRESFSGDTTVWVVDLDYDMYSIPQANLYVTRILRKLNFSRIIARERETGGIVFSALFPNGQPLKIHFTSP
ncbi:MAG: hypothetical protein B1H09_07370 [Gemmatimonadaceae bacterium 4484_173]|nr:MAG: hypothetical protein B1H09_07370 [Gemmatimonadaceae bacterium 4484_173]RKZ02967.1 MAG: hypothetical protein DRQ21_07045 [Candidatus Fermentibacteria bacterium]